LAYLRINNAYAVFEATTTISFVNDKNEHETSAKPDGGSPGIHAKLSAVLLKNSCALP
jgi:hypothetical protein